MTPLLEEKVDLTNDFFKDQESRETLPQNFLLGDFTWDAFDRLAQCGKQELDLQSMLSSLPQRRSKKASPLERVPPELLNIIISDPCLDVEDVIAFGLASQSLWLHVLGHIQDACAKAPWAGTPLLCTGSYLMSVPPAIHALYPIMEQEEKEFFNRPGRGSRGCPARGICPARKFNWNSISDYVDRTDHDHREVWLNSFTNLRGSSGIPDGYLNALQVSLKDALSVTRPADPPRTWILRNHTTHEFVSLKACRMYGKQERCVHVNGLPWLSLDKALILRICWAAPSPRLYNDDKDENEYDTEHNLMKKLKRGQWAGHSFDVVCAEGTELSEQWHDVTKEVVKEGRAWKAAFAN